MAEDTKALSWTFIGLAIGILVLIAYMGWRAKRWVNWKFSYGKRVEVRIEKVEERVEALEQVLIGQKLLEKGD